MNAIIFDTETTSADDPELIEAAWVRFGISGMMLGDGVMSRRYKPTKRINLGAMAVHHIMDEDLDNEMASATFRLPDNVDYIIGHNIDFDWRVIGSPPVKRICVLALCRYLWPNADAHTQGAMLYMLERDMARHLLTRAHQAANDVKNCALILQNILIHLRLQQPIDSFEDLWNVSEVARVPTMMSFGKHKGQPIARVPRDYKQWLLDQPDCDPYLAKALRAERKP